MAREDDYVPVGVKRSIWLHSHGRCQYRNCIETAASIDPITGKVTELGRYAHILPVGDGPRAEYKTQFPDIDLNSFANIILLCSDHHDLIDKLEVSNHPPEILFRMKYEKSNLINDTITEELHQQSDFEIDLEDYQRQYQLSDVIDQFSRARALGPKQGLTLFKTAESTMRGLLKNPFFKKGELAEVFLSTEYYFSRLYLSYKRQPWFEALKHTERALRLPLPDAMHFHLYSCSMSLVRDEYGVFQVQERLSLISQIFSSLDKKVDLQQKRRAAFLLLIKSALLRWRGRFERGPIQRNTNGEALRCCDKSFELSGNLGCLLQKALINYSAGLAFQLSEAPKHAPFFKKCFEILESPELADFPAAIKYRPRIYRETYQFEKSIHSFWYGVSRYPAEFKRVAYIVGEAAVGEHYHRGRDDTQSLSDAKAFLEQAIAEGYNHGRNIISYIGCRGAMDPGWFRNEVLGAVLAGDESEIKWEDLIARVRNILYDPHDKYDEPSFGVDGGEFWNTLGGVTGRTLLDHASSIRLLQIAEKHAEVSGGKFRAYVGLARQYKEIGDLPNYKRYLNAMRTMGRAHQLLVFEELEKW